MRIAFTTLGCKINQFETDVIRQDLQARGNVVVPFDAEADVYIINTCSVTAKSDYQCRQIIKSAIRRANGAKVVVTGCYAETRPDEIRNLTGADMVFGNRDKTMIADHIASTASSLAIKGSTEDSMPIKTLRGRTRGFLKVQDGCNNRCSYCIVPLARGRSKSIPPKDVAREFERMAQAGYPEIVLTGIHIGSYGSDLDERTTLTELVSKLLAARGGARIRLSSIEPGEITDELIGFLGNGLCRHVHIPLQSGDDGILSAMRRNYSSQFYRDLLEKISKQVPGIALGADVMVGFPGEEDSAFQNTVRLIEETPLTHLHVFSYSPRPGTLAADMKDQVPENIKKKRSDILRALGKKKNDAFRYTCLGKEFSVVVEDKVDATTGLLTGLTDNYIRLHIKGSKNDQIGKKINTRLTDVNSSSCFACIL